MSMIQPKQIKKVLASVIKITGCTLPAGTTSANVNTWLTSALTVAGNNGVSVPFQTSTDVFTPGIVVTAPTNRCEIFDGTSKQKWTSVTGDEIYGKITVSGGNYFLGFFYLNTAGVENTYALPGGNLFDFDFVYRFSLDSLPADGIVAIMTRNISQDPRNAGSVPKIERLTVTATNVISQLGNIPAIPAQVKLNINGKAEYAIGPSPAFAVAGTNITWNAGNAGYPLETTDIVFAEYTL